MVPYAAEAYEITAAKCIQTSLRWAVWDPRVSIKQIYPKLRNATCITCARTVERDHS